MKGTSCQLAPIRCQLATNFSRSLTPSRKRIYGLPRERLPHQHVATSPASSGLGGVRVGADTPGISRFSASSGYPVEAFLRLASLGSPTGRGARLKSGRLRVRIPPWAPATHLPQRSRRPATTRCSAVGSALASGARGRRFEPSHRDHRGVAQSGSALHWGCRGRRFESCRPDHAAWLRRSRCTPRSWRRSRPQQPPTPRRRRWWVRSRTWSRRRHPSTRWRA